MAAPTALKWAMPRPRRHTPGPPRRWARWATAPGVALLAVALLVAACGDSDTSDINVSAGTGDGATAPTGPDATGGPTADAGTGGSAGTDTPSTGDNPAPAPSGPDTGDQPGDGTAPAPTPTPPPLPTEPLTGELLEDNSIMDRPALAVKIGTSNAGRPQSGINQADMLIEVRVEGITRLIAVYHSQGAEPLGPVRSARSSDPDILANFGRPIFGHSGANPGVLAELAEGHAAGKLYELRWDDLPNDYWRVGDQAAPFNLYTTTSAIWNAAPAELTAPEALFEYRREGEELPAGADPVPGVEIRYLGGNESIAHFVWDADAAGWARWQDGTPHVDMAREPDGTPNPDIDPVQVTPANVVVLQTRYLPSAPSATSPQAITADPQGGVALVFTDGHLIRGRWERPTAAEPWKVTDGNGNPVRLTPGQTFIALPGGDVLVMVEDFARNLLNNR